MGAAEAWTWWKPLGPKLMKTVGGQKLWKLMRVAEAYNWWKLMKTDENRRRLKLMKTAGPEIYETWWKPPDLKIDENCRAAGA